MTNVDSMSRRKALGEALRDENGLQPTPASLDVLVSVLFAIERTDENWEFPGAPSSVDYAKSVREFLRRRYQDRNVL